MSLYNHVPGKDLLLEVAADLGGPADFRRAVRRRVGTLWAGFQTRPWMLRVPLDHAQPGPNHLAWLDRLLRPLLAAGLAGAQARVAALHLTALVLGTAQISMNMTGVNKTEDGIPRANADLTRVVTEFLDPADYPALTAVHAAEIEGGGDPSLAPAGADGLPFELSFGVDRFLDGVEVWVAKAAQR